VKQERTDVASAKWNAPCDRDVAAFQNASGSDQHLPPSVHVTISDK